MAPCTASDLGCCGLAMHNARRRRGQHSLAQSTASRVPGRKKTSAAGTRRRPIVPAAHCCTLAELCGSSTRHAQRNSSSSAADPSPEDLGSPGAAAQTRSKRRPACSGAPAPAAGSGREWPPLPHPSSSRLCPPPAPPHPATMPTYRLMARSPGALNFPAGGSSPNVVLSAGRVTRFGRAPDSDVRLPANWIWISSRHCELYYEEAQVRGGNAGSCTRSGASRRILHGGHRPPRRSSRLLLCISQLPGHAAPARSAPLLQGTWMVKDLSTNGTFVNNTKVGKGKAAPLKPGDTVRALWRGRSGAGAAPEHGPCQRHERAHAHPTAHLLPPARCAPVSGPVECQ